ncbi:hypothetical protein J4437_00395 [Candidatus Woesearchaeota archaeon]|nr:hypothetical protein [Candidatus Woesearchaeota archaeon]
MIGKKTKLLIQTLLILLLLLAEVIIVRNLNGWALGLELFGLLVLVTLFLIGIVNYYSRGERAFFLFFLLFLSNVVLLWLFRGKLYVILLFLALCGLLFSFFETSAKQKVQQEEQREKLTDKLKYSGPYSEVFPATEIIHETEEKSVENDKDYLDLTNTEQNKTEGKTTERTVSAKKGVKKVFSPGKYVASKFGNTYHEPKCEWAKRIKSYKQVWLESKEIAWEKGFKAHKCVN